MRFATNKDKERVISALERLTREALAANPADFTALEPILARRSAAVEDLAQASLGDADLVRLERLRAAGETLAERVRVVRALAVSGLRDLSQIQSLAHALSPEDRRRVDVLG